MVGKTDTIAIYRSIVVKLLSATGNPSTARRSPAPGGSGPSAVDLVCLKPGGALKGTNQGCTWASSREVAAAC